MLFLMSALHRDVQEDFFLARDRRGPVEIIAPSELSSDSSGKKQYRKIRDTKGLDILHTIEMKIPANFSVVEPAKSNIARRLGPYGIDGWEFCIMFDGATFEYFPKLLYVTVFVYETYYSFEFTKPQWLGAPLSKKTDQALLGHAPH